VQFCYSYSFSYINVWNAITQQLVIKMTKYYCKSNSVKWRKLSLMKLQRTLSCIKITFSNQCKDLILKIFLNLPLSSFKIEYHTLILRSGSLLKKLADMRICNLINVYRSHWKHQCETFFLTILHRSILHLLLENIYHVNLQCLLQCWILSNLKF